MTKKTRGRKPFGKKPAFSVRPIRNANTIASLQVDPCGVESVAIAALSAIVGVGAYLALAKLLQIIF